jgi:hypothetical protein
MYWAPAFEDSGTGPSPSSSFLLGPVYKLRMNSALLRDLAIRIANSPSGLALILRQVGFSLPQYVLLRIVFRELMYIIFLCNGVEKETEYNVNNLLGWILYGY